MLLEGGHWLVGPTRQSPCLDGVLGLPPSAGSDQTATAWKLGKGEISNRSLSSDKFAQGGGPSP